MDDRVFDAGPIIAFLEDEEGADVAEQLILNPPGGLYIHAANLTEVFYHLRRSQGEDGAERLIERLERIGFVIREDMDRAFCRAAGRLKADLARISLADCFGVTLAARIGGEFVTTDHGEMDALVPLGLCPIRFIR